MKTIKTTYSQTGLVKRHRINDDGPIKTEGTDASIDELINNSSILTSKKDT